MIYLKKLGATYIWLAVLGLKWLGHLFGWRKSTEEEKKLEFREKKGLHSKLGGQSQGGKILQFESRAVGKLLELQKACACN